MSDDRQATNGEAERVGYGRPLKHTQFQKGNRAYLHRRGARARDDFAESVRATLTSKVKIREGGRKRTVTRIEANILALFDKAKRGDAAAANRLIDLHEASATGAGDGPMVIEVHNALPDANGEYHDRLLAEGSAKRSPSRRRTSHEAWRNSRSQISLLPNAVRVVAAGCGATRGRNRIRRNPPQKYSAGLRSTTTLTTSRPGK